MFLCALQTMAPLFGRCSCAEDEASAFGRALKASGGTLRETSAYTALQTSCTTNALTGAKYASAVGGVFGSFNGIAAVEGGGMTARTFVAQAGKGALRGAGEYAAWVGTYLSARCTLAERRGADDIRVDVMAGAFTGAVLSVATCGINIVAKRATVAGNVAGSVIVAILFGRNLREIEKNEDELDNV